MMWHGDNLAEEHAFRLQRFTSHANQLALRVANKHGLDITDLVGDTARDGAEYSRVFRQTHGYAPSTVEIVNRRIAFVERADSDVTAAQNDDMLPEWECMPPGFAGDVDPPGVG